MYSSDREENEAQKSIRDKSYRSDGAERKKEKTSSGSEVEKTYFTDGSSITHNGGPIGDTCADELGNEC